MLYTIFIARLAEQIINKMEKKKASIKGANHSVEHLGEKAYCHKQCK